MPDLYFLGLRILVCAMALFYMTRPAGVRDRDRWALSAVILFFNPVLPVGFGGWRLWALASAATATSFWVLGWRTTAAYRLRWRR